jgi:hypothetical protein
MTNPKETTTTTKDGVGVNPRNVMGVEMRIAGWSNESSKKSLLKCVDRSWRAQNTHEHIDQFLAQVNNAGIMNVHKVRLFPLSLSSTMFNWFTSLAPQLN